MMFEEETTEQIIHAAVEVQRHLGPGLPESVYEECLLLELASKGLRVRRQKLIRFRYKTIHMIHPLGADLVVNNLVLLQVKAVDPLPPANKAQILTYLRLTGYPRGLLLNFNVSIVSDGTHRFIHTENDSMARRLGDG